MNQLVSIIIPAFNAEKWISSCIESAVSQTWSRKEIIVVDDGSRDATLKIAESFTSPELRVVSQVNRGASAARNHGLSLAQGDYIQWLDADDLLAPDKISTQMEGAEEGNKSRILLSGSWGKFFYRLDRSRFEPNSLWQDLTPVECLFRKIDGNLWMAIESWLVSRSLTDLAGPWNEDLSLDDDGEYFSRIVSRAEKIRFVSGSRCFIRRSSVGLSHDLNLNDRKLDSLVFSLSAHTQRLLSLEDSPRTRAACLKLLNRWALYFYPERMDIFNTIKSMAVSLGGGLDIPRVRPRYRLIQKFLGIRTAKKVQRLFPYIKSFIAKNLERLTLSNSKNP